MRTFFILRKTVFLATLSALAFVLTQRAVAQGAGASWVPMSGLSNFDGLSSDLSENGEVGVLTTWSHGGYLTTNGGASWTSIVPTLTANAVAISTDGSRIYIAPRDVPIQFSNDGGATFTAATGIGGFFYDVACSADGMTAVACRWLSSVYVTSDGGATWTERTIPGASGIQNADCSSDGTKIVAADRVSGFIYTSTDSGATWSQRAFSADWSDVTSSADGTKLAATVSGGQIYTSSDSGATWTARDSARNWRKIDSSSDGSVLVSTDGLHLYTSNDSGENWTQRLAAGSPGGWRGTSVSGDGTVMYAPLAGSPPNTGAVTANPLYVSAVGSAPSISGLNRYLITGGNTANANAMRLMRLNPDGTALLSNVALPSLALPSGSAKPVYHPTNGYLVFGGTTLNLNAYLAGGAFTVNTVAGLANNAPWSAHLPSGRFLTPRRNGTGNAPVETLNPVTGTITSGANHGAFIPEASWIYGGNLYTLNEGFGLLQIAVAGDGSTTGSMTSAPTNFATALAIPHGDGGYTETSRLAIDPSDGMALFSTGHQHLYLFDFDGPYVSGGYTAIDLHSHLITSGGGFTYHPANTAGYGVAYDSGAGVFFVAGSLINAAFNEFRGFLVRVTKAGAVTVLAQELAGDSVYNGSSGGLAYAEVDSNAFSLPENSANGTAVGTLTATDPDPGTVLSDWTIVSGNTGGAFALNASTGQITVANSAALNFESAPSFTLVVTVSDGENTSAPVNVTITLTDVNEPATDITLTNSTINENAPANTVVGALAATGDPEPGATHTFSLVAGAGGADNGAFNISGTNLRLTGSANYETKDFYNVRVRATDNLGATYDKAFVITVNDVNEPPTGIGLSATSLPENSGANAVVGTISAIGDPDVGSAHTFELVAGTGDEDNSAFNVSTHFLRLTANGDFEAKPSYSIRLRANDGLGGSVEQEFTITLTDVNEPPTGLSLSNSSIDENTAPNSTVGTLTATGDPDAGASHTYSFVPGAGDTDNTSFNILGNALRLTGVADFETKSSYSVRIQASDGQGGTFDDAYTITVNNLPEGATDITLTNATLPENNTPPTTVGTLAALGDPEPGDTHTFSLVAGIGDDDNASFLVIDSTLRLNVAANFESKSGYSIRVRADDGGGGLFDKALTVSITNVNEPPTDLSLSNATLPENSGANGVVGLVAALGDPDAGATHVFTLVTGAGSTDNAHFTLTGSTLRIVPNPDFEAKSSYSLRIRADDGLGGIFEKFFVVTITDVNEPPTEISLSNASIPENAGPNTAIGLLAALGDPDAGATHGFSFVSGTGSADNAAFNISGNELRLSASADFETKSSYSVRVQADDGLGGTFAKAFTITITDVNEAPTDITFSNSFVSENAGANAVVGTLAAVDPDAGATHGFTFVAGPGDDDNADFNLLGNILRLTASADFETQSSYSVRVQADDGLGGVFAKALVITITNVNEAPTDISLSNASIPENAGPNAVVGAISALGDPDAGATHGFSLVGGAGDDDNASFNISGANLRLTANANFEAKSSYSVRIRADDGLGGIFAKSFTITITNANEPPTDISLSNSSVPENAGTNAVVGLLAALGDPDAGATHGFSLVAGAGSEDNGAFNVSGGELRLTASADFETKSSYSVRVRADDGLGGTFDKAFTITVTNVNEPPTDISLSNSSLPENAGANAVVGDFTALGDPDAGSLHTFAFVAGAGDTDNGAFILSGKSLRLSASADFETKSSYSIRVEASDGLGGTFARSFTISITNVNEAPTDLTLSNQSISENLGVNAVVGVLSAVGDPDAGAAHSFSLVAGAGSTDNAAFNINGNQLRLTANGDFETKSTYSVRLEAGDGLGGTFAKAFTITITDVNEAPTDITLSNASIEENAGVNGIVGAFGAVGDPDAGAAHVFSLVPGGGGDDNAAFNLSGAVLRLSASANYEAKNLYQVRVRADDGFGGFYEKPFVVTIIDVNEAPSVTNVTAVGDEDAPGIVVTFAGIDPDSNLLAYSIVTGPDSGEGTLGAVVGDTVVFTPAADFNGEVVFSYKANDGSLDSNVATATVTVNAVNDRPTITDIEAVAILEDGTTGALSFVIGDVDGDSLTVTASTNDQVLAPDGGIELGGTGAGRTITVTPEADQNGVVTVTVNVSDGVLDASDSFIVTVTPVNDAPTFDLDTGLSSPPVPGAPGRIWAWGANGSGQLGDGSMANAAMPVQAGTQTDWVHVVAGDNHTFGLKQDGTLWSWGANSYGQLGDGTTLSGDIPRQVGEDDDWSSLSAGDGHVLALKRNGTLWAWGRNDFGQLGNDSTSHVSMPQQIGIDTNWRSVSAGSQHSVALKNDGTLWAWGRNQFGQVGDGSTTSRRVPLQIGVAADWDRISAGGLHTTALKSDGTLWAWGRNTDGQLGDGTTSQRNAPKQIGLDDEWSEIASGYTHVVALKSDDTLWAWGRNSEGQLGDGTRVNRTTPVLIGDSVAWETVTAGRQHSGALKSDGSLWVWGDNDASQMGSLTTGDFLVPTRLGEEVWSAIAGGLGHTVAIEAETARITVPANSGLFTLADFVYDIFAGPLDEQGIQAVEFLVENDDPFLFVMQPAIDPSGTLTLVPGVDAGTMTVTVRAKDDGGTADSGIDTSLAKTFTIVITVAPEIDLSGNSVPIINGDDTPDPADHTDFEETPTVGGTVVRTFTITNPGTAPLFLGGISIDGSTAFSLTTPPASNVVERLGGAQTFSITFDPATAGLHTARVSIESDDEDENPFVFDIAGVGITPEISITGNSTEILNGDATPVSVDHTDFGSTEVVGGSVSRTFTIHNTGTQDLTLGGDPLVSLSGSAAFTVITMPATNPVPKTNGSTPFVVLFDPASRGVHAAVVSIANNDEDEAPYTFTIRGIGLAPEISISANGVEILSGDTVPSANDHTLFGSIGAAMVRTYTIVNEGNLVMNLGSPAVSVTGSTSFTVQAQPDGSTVAAELGSRTFSIAFDPTAPGVQTATVSVASDDTDESPYTFTIRGNGLTQVSVSSFRAVIGSGRINLATLVGASPAGGIFSGPGVEGDAFNPNGLAPGDYTLKYTVKDAIGQDLETDISVTVELSPPRLRVEKPRGFPATTVGTNSRPQTIEIENLGGKPAESVRVVLSGTGKKDFRITQPGSTIRGGGKDSFRVTFSPRKEGARKATAIISSSAGPVSIKLSGRGKARNGGGGGHLPGG